ncbi:MAG: hypothetical protein ACTHJ8_19725 [Mucilaginibacter sp.]
MPDLISSKKVVLISSGQPSLNPRLVKEADALVEAGYDVTVLYAYWNDWGTQFDKELIPTKKWKAVCVGGDPENNKATYFFSRVIHKIARIINKAFDGKRLAEPTLARPAYSLVREAKKHEADIYISHNLGALPATVKTAKLHKKPCGFDAEDLHRFEMSNDKNDPDVKLKSFLEDKYIPQTDYLTASSDQIAAAYKQLFTDKGPVTIRNVFPKETAIRPHVINENHPVKLLWLSQTIGPKRGLQDALKALDILKSYPFELHLLGYSTEPIRTEMSASRLNIHFHQPIPSTELALFSSQFDIGLALEPGFSTNNDLALSNKIFTYLQAGLGIIVSDTTAQKAFLAQYPQTGKLYPKGNAQALADILLNYYLHRDQLLEAKNASLKLARQELNWETEQQKFLKVVADTLNRFE